MNKQISVNNIIAFCNRNIYFDQVNWKNSNSPWMLSTTLHSSPAVFSFIYSLLKLAFGEGFLELMQIPSCLNKLVLKTEEIIIQWCTTVLFVLFFCVSLKNRPWPLMVVYLPLLAQRVSSDHNLPKNVIKMAEAAICPASCKQASIAPRVL